MATKTTQQHSTDGDYEQMFADYVYQIPGIVLIAAGFGGLALLSLA